MLNLVINVYICCQLFFLVKFDYQFLKNFNLAINLLKRSKFLFLL